MTVTLNTVGSNAAYQPYVPRVSPAAAGALASEAASQLGRAAQDQSRVGGHAD